MLTFFFDTHNAFASQVFLELQLQLFLEYGDGEKGVNARVFRSAGALWDWCCNHIMSLSPCASI